MSEPNPIEMFLYAIKSDETKEKYVTRMKTFFRFIEMEGDFEEQSKSFIGKARGDNQWAFAQVMKFITYQKERAERGEIADSTVPNYYKPLKLFLEMNDITLSWKKISRGLPRARRHALDRAPSIEEIRKLSEYPDRRIKAIVYTMSSAGIRLGAWGFLKWKHIFPVERDGQVVSAKMTVYAGDDEQYTTFISPEAYRELEKWMKFREACGERISGDSWLMRDLWDIAEAGKGLVSVPKKLEPNGIKRLIERALWAQGLRKELQPGQRRHEWKTSHGFRKYFKSRAEQIMRPINVEILMGHSTGVSDSYYRPNENELLDDYLRAVPLLQISEVEEARQELAVAEKSWKSQFDEMKERLETLESSVQTLTTSILVAKTRALEK